MSTLYITEQDSNFQVQHSYLKVFHQQKQCVSIRLSNISQIILFGNTKLPKEVVKVVFEHQIPVLYLTVTGELIGRLENPAQRQYKYLNYQRQRALNAQFNHATVESIVWAKLHNQYTFLQSWTRHYSDYTTQRALNYLTLLMDNLPIATSLNEMREYSEEADKVYCNAVTSLLKFHTSCSYFQQKRINGFFNLGYQLLHQYIYTLLDTTGLHPNYAILHRNVDHELPLAWDLTTEFRKP